MKSLIIKALIILTFISAILIWNFGWSVGLIAFAAFMVLLLIGSGTIGHIILYFKNRK